ncbi:MAG: hypothetical protein MUF42_13600 [Cytophagaceae bacterium]|nr:hypothetical protein [Cytophagaceae bacterium]
MKHVRNVYFLVGICLGLVVFATTSGKKQNLHVFIQPTFGKQALTLETQAYRSTQGDTVFIDVFRFYISNLQILYRDGKTFSIPNSYYLIDASDTASCHLQLSSLPLGAIAGLSFHIGVDSAKSVSGAHAGDLDLSKGMYWSWNSGYINAKLEGRSPSCLSHKQQFEFHVGGYAHPNNSLRKAIVMLPVNTSAEATSRTLQLQADVSVWFAKRSLREQAGIMIPGKAAMALADEYKHMFRLQNDLYEK